MPGLEEPGVFTGIGGKVWQSQVSSQGSAAGSGRARCLHKGRRQVLAELHKDRWQGLAEQPIKTN